MLDSDDLLGRTYMEEAAAFVTEGFPVDIVPGCMRNFDAVSNDWCFPEGWSVQVTPGEQGPASPSLTRLSLPLQAAQAEKPPSRRPHHPPPPKGRNSLE